MGLKQKEAMIFLNGLDIDIITIATHYGYKNQSRQLIEEMAELIQAINKLERMGYTDGDALPKDRPEYKNMVEEMADVQLMLCQIEYLLDCRTQVNKVEKRKAKRQIHRICGEK